MGVRKPRRPKAPDFAAQRRRLRLLLSERKDPDERAVVLDALADVERQERELAAELARHAAGKAGNAVERARRRLMQAEARLRDGGDLDAVMLARRRLKVLEAAAQAAVDAAWLATERTKTRPRTRVEDYYPWSGEITFGRGTRPEVWRALGGE